MMDKEDEYEIYKLPESESSAAGSVSKTAKSGAHMVHGQGTCACAFVQCEPQLWLGERSNASALTGLVLTLTACHLQK